MADYTQLTNFTAKDTLPTGDPNKIVLGADHDLEYGAIETAIATKANKISGGTNGNVVTRDANGDIQDSGLTTADVTSNWVEIYNLASPVTLASAWQEDVISSTYSMYKLYMTYGMTAADTLTGLVTQSGTPDGSNVYRKFTSTHALTATPGPTVTGSAAIGNWYVSTDVGAGPGNFHIEAFIRRLESDGQQVWFDYTSMAGTAAHTVGGTRYVGASGAVDGLQFTGTLNITIQKLVIHGLRNG